MPNVAFIRNEVKKLIPLYEMIADCLEGEKRIKTTRMKYLPMPNAEDTSKQNVARYEAYLQRSVFYNVTKRTLAGLVGFVFLRDPNVTAPTALKPLIDDATGGGVPLTQLSKQAVTYVLAFGRAGLFVDYPAKNLPKENGEDEEQPTTVAELASGEVRPTMTVYGPKQIINWRTIKRGAKTVLSLVVLQEEYDYEGGDGFELKCGTQWRVLRLNDEGNYQVELWRQTSATYALVPGYPVVINGADGSPLKDILFTFIGVDNNDAPPDQPPLYDLASLNIAHYRNSADYEESCFIVGQPTPVFAGLTKDWVDSVLKGVVALGSRGAVPLPTGGTAELLQAAPNTMPFEAMEHKEKQMVALGAKLVENRDVQRTATEADQSNASETSVLASAANNTNSAVKMALTWAGERLMGVSGEIEYKIHSDLGLSKMSPEQRGELVREWQAGAVTFEEMRNALRQAGIATVPDEKAKEQIAAEQAASLALEMAATPPGGNGGAA